MAMKRYTDDEREEAADACAMLASSDDFHLPGAPAIDRSNAICRTSRADHLVRLAMASTLDHPTIAWDSWRERWSEAEARLRCGWTPGGAP